MITRIQKWGNSLAFRIPKAMAEELNLTIDSQVEIKEEQGKIMISPVKEPEFNLDELLVRMTPENLHREVDTGQPTGQEIW